MHFLTEFDRAFIVNLPERADRRRQMETMLAKINVPLVPGRIDFFPAIRPAAADGFPSIGARGCFLSHLEILKRARAEGVHRLLVMEDDLQIDPIPEELALRCLESLRSQPWDLLYLGHVLELNKEVSSTVVFQESRENIQTTHFYAVNGPMIGRLIAFLELVLSRPPGHPDGGPMHVDGALCTFRKQNPDVVTLVAWPSLGRQRPSRSDIAPLRWYDRFPLFRSMASFYRSLRW